MAKSSMIGGVFELHHCGHLKPNMPFRVRIISVEQGWLFTEHLDDAGNGYGEPVWLSPTEVFALIPLAELVHVSKPAKARKA